MKAISWNVNGIRAALNKGFETFALDSNADFICIQETKAMPDQADLSFLHQAGYQTFWNSADKKGYSGVLTASRLPVHSVTKGIDEDEHDHEGRVITVETDEFFIVNVYTPNAQDGLRRLSYRQTWDAAFLLHLQRLENQKPVIFGGDLNVAHEDIDLARPESNRFNPGFSDQERDGFRRILHAGWIDSFRHFDKSPSKYSWWSYRAGARQNNVGWRIDYWMVSEKLKSRLRGAAILPHILGSDHCPVELTLD